jgi:multidrug resistance efflux pump
MDKETEIIHGSIHAEYRQALADNQWALAKANARIKVQEQQIDELKAQLAAKEAPPED